MKHWIVGAFVAIALYAGAQPTGFAAMDDISPSEFEWVQSSARSNYYFNKQQIRYGRDADGNINDRILLVPTLLTYDDVQIKDVIAKRRWNALPLDGYDDLAGASEYLRINLDEHTVTIEGHSDLDSTGSPLSTERPRTVVNIDGLADKNLDRIFYLAIIRYAEKHPELLTMHTSSADDAKAQN